MNKFLNVALCFSIFLFGPVLTANAALESRLGGMAVYDTDRDISWLANAGAVAGSIFDDAGDHNDGRVTWESASNWVASLDVAGVTGWRLPTAFNSDGSVCVGVNCTNSELGHLFYEELGGTPFISIFHSADPDMVLFSNIQDTDYWTSTIYPSDSSWYYEFDFGIGSQGTARKDGDWPVWAVHDGDVGLLSPIPEPESYAMLIVGLFVLFGLRRLRNC